MTERVLIDFRQAMEYVWNKVEKKKIAVLSTAADNRVTSRAMSFIRLGDDLYFQTDKRFLKARQIQKNKNVAVCLDNIQIEAEAEIRGHSSLPENNDFVQKYKHEHPGSYEAYTEAKHQVVVRLVIKLISLWKYSDGRPYREFVYPDQQKAERQIYEVNSNDQPYIPGGVV